MLLPGPSLPRLAGLLAALLLGCAVPAAPIRPLANDHVVVGESPSPTDTPL